MEQQTLFSGFMRSADSFPDRPAMWVNGETITYDQLKQNAQKIAATIQHHTPNATPRLTAVFAYRSATAFSGVLGALLSGHGYVPLNRTFPVERTRMMLQRSECQSMIIDAESANQLDQVLAGIEQSLLLIFPDAQDTSDYTTRWPQHIIVGAQDLCSAQNWTEPSVRPDDIAYLLFTSGSTGVPKGVMVAHCNVLSFISFIVDRYGVTEQDRCSQMFDMTFDLSVFDMFVSWERGACLFCPSQKTSINPGKFIKDHKLTMWFSVPSTAIFMKRLGMLKPDQYPSLRWSLFCGEPLPVESTKAWAQAAPNSIVENLYGPTELTIACTLYRWDASLSPDESEMGVVPIGAPFPQMTVLVVDSDLKEVPPGAEGELLMNGPQMTPGYWKDPEKTAAAFVVPSGTDEVYYRTGDRVRNPYDNNPLTHLGRVDFQVKIQGHRVELGEIEAVVRETTGRDGVVALGWPTTPSGADGIEVFIEGDASLKKGLAEQLASRLPTYMKPKNFHFLDKIPLNVNGKFDRQALTNILESSR